MPCFTTLRPCSQCGSPIHGCRHRVRTVHKNSVPPPPAHMETSQAFALGCRAYSTVQFLNLSCKHIGHHSPREKFLDSSDPTSFHVPHVDDPSDVTGRSCRPTGWSPDERSTVLYCTVPKCQIEAKKERHTVRYFHRWRAFPFPQTRLASAVFASHPKIVDCGARKSQPIITPPKETTPPLMLLFKNACHLPENSGSEPALRLEGEGRFGFILIPSRCSTSISYDKSSSKGRSHPTEPRL
jgi:hypothetical protein